MKNRLIFFAGLFVLLACWWLSAYGSSSEAADTAGLRQVALRVEGMT